MVNIDLYPPPEKTKLTDFSSRICWFRYANSSYFSGQRMIGMQLNIDVCLQMTAASNRSNFTSFVHRGVLLTRRRRRRKEEEAKMSPQQGEETSREERKDEEDE